MSGLGHAFDALHTTAMFSLPESTNNDEKHFFLIFLIEENEENVKNFPNWSYGGKIVFPSKIDVFRGGSRPLRIRESQDRSARGAPLLVGL